MGEETYQHVVKFVRTCWLCGNFNPSYPDNLLTSDLSVSDHQIKLST